MNGPPRAGREAPLANGGRRGRAEPRFEVSVVRVSRPSFAPDGVLRQFVAQVDRVGLAGGAGHIAGSVTGWFGFTAWLPELFEHDVPIPDLMNLMTAAVEAGRASPVGEPPLDTTIVVHSMVLDGQQRSDSLGEVILQLIDLLLMTPETTLVLSLPHPSFPFGDDSPGSLPHHGA